MCKTDPKTRNYIILFFAIKCPTEAEKINKQSETKSYQIIEFGGQLKGM